PVLHGTPRGQARPHRMGAGEISVRLLNRRCDGEAAVRPLLRQAHVRVLRLDDCPRHGEGHHPRKGREVSGLGGRSAPWGALGPTLSEPLTVARNVSTRYLAIIVEMVVGLGVLPFNIHHLGSAAYGLWMLTGSIVAYFSVLDLGYSGA